MCGRFNLVTPDLEELRQYLPIDEIDIDDWMPRFNIAPSQLSPVLRISATGSKRLELLQWGILAGSGAARRAPRPINARVEDLHRRSMFRHLLGTRHCIVPATGYYEWQRNDAGKQPWLIAPAAGILAMAGLWERTIARDGTVVDTYAVITQPPQLEIASIHDRMPLLLDPTTSATWLRGDRTALITARQHPQPLIATAISDLVNHPAHDGPDVLTPQTQPRRAQLALDFGRKPGQS